MRDTPFDASCGVNAALVTTKDQGLGCAPFDSITPNPATAPIYDTAHLTNGELVAIKLISGSGVACYVEYTSATVGSQTTLLARYYLYLTANPPATLIFGDLRSETATGVSVAITTAGKLRLNGASGQIAVSATSLSLNQWVRVELDADATTPTSVQTARLYNSADAAEGSATETISGANVAGVVAFTKHRIGDQTGIGAFTWWLSNLDLNATAQLGPYVAPVPATQLYISRLGDNSDGLSWATAFTGFSQIGWATVGPGTTFDVDGGALSAGSAFEPNPSTWDSLRPDLSGKGMVYTDVLTPKSNGSSTNPITFRKAQASGRNGQIIHFGGRQKLLPEANQAVYSNGGVAGGGWAVDLRGCKYINLDGLTRSGFLWYGWGDDKARLVGHGTAIRADATTTKCRVRNFEIFDCGTYAKGSAFPSPTGWAFDNYYCDDFGVEFAGDQITFSRGLIHDNGQDNLHAFDALTNFLAEYLGLYNTRLHSTFAGFSFQAGCQAIGAQNTVHVDGLQAAGNVIGQGPITLDHCFVALESQGFYLGNEGTGTIDAATITNNLIVAVFAHGIQGDSSGSSSSPKGWLIDHNTIHNPDTKWTGYSSQWLGIELNNGDGTNVATNNLTSWDAAFFRTAAFNAGACAGNYYAGGVGGGSAIPGGTSRDPLFKNPLATTNNTPTWAQIKALDLTPTDATIAAALSGSPIHSFADLLNLIDQLNGAAPTGRVQVATRSQVATRTTVPTRTTLATRTTLG